jgi:hypothetical protein
MRQVSQRFAHRLILSADGSSPGRCISFGLPQDLTPLSSASKQPHAWQTDASVIGITVVVEGKIAGPE